MAVLNLVSSDHFRLVMCGTGLAIAAAGTVHLVRRLWRRAEFKDSENVELPVDQSHPTDGMVILEQDAEEAWVVACQQMHTYSWWQLAVRGFIIGASAIIIIAVIRLGYMKRFLAGLRFPSALALTGPHQNLTLKSCRGVQPDEQFRQKFPVAIDRWKFPNFNQLTAVRGNLRITALNIVTITGSTILEMVVRKYFSKRN